MSLRCRSRLKVLTWRGAGVSECAWWSYRISYMSCTSVVIELSYVEVSLVSYVYLYQ